MLSRVADSLYWMSRYMERSDGILRMLRINYAYSQDIGSDFSWEPVLRIFSAVKEDETEKIKHKSREVLKHMVLNKANKNSVLNVVSGARENARAVQDNVTKELWQCLNDFYHIIREDKLAASLQFDDPVSVLDNLIKQGMYYYGSAEITMPRGEGYYFMNIGKFLERAIQSVDILDVKFRELEYSLEEGTDPTYWKYLLLSISGYEIFLKSYRSALEPRNIIHQIIWNENFPRSILYATIRLRQSFETIKTDRSKESYKTLSYMIGKLENNLKYSDMKDLEKIGLQAYLQKLKDDFFGIGNALSHYYFAFN